MQVQVNKYGFFIEDFKMEELVESLQKEKRRDNCLLWIQAHCLINKTFMWNMAMNRIILWSYGIGALDMLICKS